MKKASFYFPIMLLLFLASACQDRFFLRKENMVEQAEKQKRKADMVIYINHQKQIFIERPLMNVKSSLHHPASKEEIMQFLEKRLKIQDLVLITFSDAWRGKTSLRNQTMDEMNSLLKKYFKKVVFHQEQKNFYTKILRE